MNINGFKVSLDYVSETMVRMTATTDAFFVTRFCLRQTLDGTRVEHLGSCDILTLPHNRYDLESDIPGDKNATAGCTQCVIDVLQAVELAADKRRILRESRS